MAGLFLACGGIVHIFASGVEFRGDSFLVVVGGRVGRWHVVSESIGSEGCLSRLRFVEEKLRLCFLLDFLCVFFCLLCYASISQFERLFTFLRRMCNFEAKVFLLSAVEC